jgi:hypothetical protein
MDIAPWPVCKDVQCSTTVVRCDDHRHRVALLPSNHRPLYNAGRFLANFISGNGQLEFEGSDEGVQNGLHPAGKVESGRVDKR